jgi:hypothetical protein
MTNLAWANRYDQQLSRQTSVVAPGPIIVGFVGIIDLAGH